MTKSRWVVAATLSVSAAGLLGAAQPAAGGQEITATGRVQAGVEQGCRLLPGPGRATYLLLGGDPAVVRPGALVRVRGVADPGAPSTCMQGIPLHVSEAHPVAPGRGGR